MAPAGQGRPIPSHVGIEGNMEADSELSKVGCLALLTLTTQRMVLFHRVVSNHHSRSVKLTLQTLVRAPPFLLPDEAEALLSSLGLVP